MEKDSHTPEPVDEKPHLHRAGGEFKVVGERRLSELKPGERGVVVRVGGTDSVRRMLLSLGMVCGTEVAVVRRAPLGDPIEYRLRGYSLSLRRDEAENIVVGTRK